MRTKRNSIRWIVLLVPACTVDTAVVEGDETTLDDRLGAGLGAWCEASCKKVTDCAPEEEPREDCPDDCYELFATEFVGKGDVCTAGALRLMDCIDEASCRDLELDVCDTQAEIDRCAESNGRVACQARGGGEGGAAGFGSSPPVGTSLPPCEVHYGECSNGLGYTVSCSGSAPRECECSIDGDFSMGRFNFDDRVCPEPYEARQICGWPIVPIRDEPPTPPTVSCATGSTLDGSAGGGPGGCEILFEGCSDGVTYGMTCAGSNEMCSCRVDGELVGSLVGAEAVCPYIHGPDMGAAAMNYACGFSIQSPSPEL